MSRAHYILLGALVVLSLGGTAYWLSPRAAPQQVRTRVAPVPVGVAVVSRHDVPVYVTGLGTVQASQTVAIHSQVEGVLQDVLFTEGQQVKKRDVLARIEPRLYRAALDQAKAKKAQDAALLAASDKDLARYIALGQRNIVSRQDVDQQQAKNEQLKASIAADDAAIETAQTELDYTDIKAPEDGRVGIRLIDRGNLVRATDAGSITTLVVTQPSAVVFTLPSNQLDEVRSAMARGPVEVAALDQDNVRVLSRGTLLLVDNTIDASTATIRLKGIFANADDRLWPGEFVNARVLTDTRRDATTVPVSAVQHGPQGAFAWVISANQTAEVRALELGPTSDEVTVITRGLTAGETVVIDGQYKLRPGAQITATPPAATPRQDAK